MIRSSMRVSDGHSEMEMARCDYVQMVRRSCFGFGAAMKQQVISVDPRAFSLRFSGQEALETRGETREERSGSNLGVNKLPKTGYTQLQPRARSPDPTATTCLPDFSVVPGWQSRDRLDDSDVTSVLTVTHDWCTGVACSLCRRGMGVLLDSSGGLASPHLPSMSCPGVARLRKADRVGATCWRFCRLPLRCWRRRDRERTPQAGVEVDRQPSRSRVPCSSQ